jgi:hypothetical protein
MTDVDVVCVLWGTEYSEDYVHILKNMIERNTTVPFTFKAFTDRPIEGINTIQLPVGLKGWWNKIYLFNKRHMYTNALSKRVVYFDLDTVITGNIDFLLEYKGEIMGIENLGVNNRFEDSKKYQNVFQSGVLAWNHEWCGYIYDAFIERKEEIISNIYGDGEYMHMLFSELYVKPDLLQHLYPNKLKSYKYEVYENGLDKETSIVCFHGIPRPHQAINQTTYPWGVEFLPSVWINDYWRLS